MRLKEEEAAKGANTNPTQDSFFVKALTREQKKKKTPYMVVQSKPKRKIDL